MPDKTDGTGESELMTTTDAAKVLHVDRATVARWVRLGQLPGVRLPSGRIRVRRVDVERLLRTTDE